MANQKIKLEDFELGSEDINVDRMRKMKALARTLYHEDIVPKRRGFKPIRAKGVISVISVLAILILSVTSLYNFNRFISLQEAVFSAKGHVEANLQRRKNLFGNLVNITLNQAAIEEEIFRHVADVRSDLNKTKELLTEIAKDPNALAFLDSPTAGQSTTTIASSLSRLLAVVEQYPDLKSSTTYQQLMDKLVEIENRISERRTEYNDNARMYNHAVSAFPWYLLAKATGFSRVDYFKASPEVEKVPVLNSNTFQRLLPKITKDR